jgi:hypothetical protein
MTQHCARTRFSDHSPRSPKEEGNTAHSEYHWFPVKRADLAARGGSCRGSPAALDQTLENSRVLAAGTGRRVVAGGASAGEKGEVAMRKFVAGALSSQGCWECLGKRGPGLPMGIARRR